MKTLPDTPEETGPHIARSCKGSTPGPYPGDAGSTPACATKNNKDTPHRSVLFYYLQGGEEMSFLIGFMGGLTVVALLALGGACGWAAHKAFARPVAQQK